VKFIFLLRAQNTKIFWKKIMTKKGEIFLMIYNWFFFCGISKQANIDVII